jgi:pyrimidine-specific ribonucleoside hydrolase
MQQVLQLFQKGSVPVSFGKPTSLSPISTFPLQWKIEIDEFFQKQDLPDTDTPLSVYDSDQLIAKVLRESDVAVAVIATGPATNLALALQNEPELIDRVSGLFLMGEC